MEICRQKVYLPSLIVNLAELKYFNFICLLSCGIHAVSGLRKEEGQQMAKARLLPPVEAGSPWMRWRQAWLDLISQLFNSHQSSKMSNAAGELHAAGDMVW